MNKITRALSALMLSCVAMCAAAQETWVDFNETTFPDPNFRAQLENKNKPSGTTNSVTIQDGKIRVDKLTNIGSIANNVTDVTGIKNFFNLSSVDFSLAGQKGLKFIDVRGMKKLSSIKLTPYGYTGDGSFSGTGNKSVIIETVLLDETPITTVYLQRCGKLKHLSVAGCEKLTSVYAHNCDLMGLDVSTCPKITTIKVEENHNMSWIKFGEVNTGLKTLHMCGGKVNELVLPPTLTTRTFSGLNIDGNPISRLDLTPLAGKTISGFIFRNCALRILPLYKNKIYQSGTWADSKNTQKLNVGCVNSFQIHKPGELGTNESVSNVKGGTYDASTGMFTFNEGVTTATYTFTAYNNSYKQYTFNVTVTRELAPLQLYLEYTPEASAAGEEARAAASDNGAVRTAIPNVGENEYELSLDRLVGNFRIVQVNPDGSEVYLGANSAEVTHHYADRQTGYVRLFPGNEYALHRDQPTPSKSHIDKVAQTPQPSWEYTTHPDGRNGEVAAIPNAKLNIKYINGEPAGHLTVGGGTPTGIDELPVDGVAGEDTDAGKPVEYYNIQGMRVNGDCLTPGIYVRRQGSRVEKILVK